jgi:hypothetical protein
MNEDLNNIQLNATMIASLYQRTLVQLTENTSTLPAAAPVTEPDIRFLGNNMQKVTVLVDNPGHTFLPEDQLAFLTKMLGACKLNIGDVAIVNMANGASLSEVISFLKPSRLISFGVPVSNTGAREINAPLLNELVVESDHSKALKIKLWASLKQMFGV